MNESISDSFSEDETDIYVNSVARLKALKKKYVPKGTREAGPEFKGCREDAKSATVIKHKGRELEDLNNEIVVYDDTGLDNSLPKCPSCGTFDRSCTRSCKESLLQEQVSAVKSRSQRVEIDEDSVVIDLDEDSDEIPVENKEDDNYEIDVKIQWRSQAVHRISMLRHDSFEKVFQYFASLEGVSVDQVLIMRKEIMIKRTDTPALLHLSVIDILDGGIVSSAMITRPELCVEQKRAETNLCNIKVQTSSKQAIVVPLKRDERLTAVIAMCAERLNVKESSIKLYFDGECVCEDETPESLEFEDEACIDLRLCST